MAEKKAFLTPTLVTYDAMHRRGEEVGLPEQSPRKNEGVRRACEWSAVPNATRSRSAMMSVQLDNSYGVVCHRGKDDFWVRALYLEAVASEPGAFKHFAIYFIEKDDPTLGQGYVNPDNGYVVPLLPARDFDALYHLMQTEKKLTVTELGEG